MVEAFDSWEKDSDFGAGKHSGFCIRLGFRCGFIGRRAEETAATRLRCEMPGRIEASFVSSRLEACVIADEDGQVVVLGLGPSLQGRDDVIGGGFRFEACAVFQQGG